MAVSSREVLHNRIRQRFSEQIQTPQSVTVLYDNAPFTPPDNARWVAWSIREATADQVELGSDKRFRIRGTAIANIYVPIRDGDESALELADAIDAAFKSVTVSDVTYQTPTVNTIGLTGDWWQVNVICPWFADQTG